MGLRDGLGGVEHLAGDKGGVGRAGRTRSTGPGNFADLAAPVVGVEAGGDGGDAEVLFHPQGVNLGHVGAAQHVKRQAGFGASLGGPDRASYAGR